MNPVSRIPVRTSSPILAGDGGGTGDIVGATPLIIFSILTEIICNLKYIGQTSRYLRKGLI